MALLCYNNKMTPQTYIFIGRSGSGKGTQVNLLIDLLKQKDSERDVFYLESGQKFRDLLSQEGHTQDLAREISKRGELQPAFLAIHIWSHIMIESLTGNEHLVIDGTPRSFSESAIFDTAMRFYNRERPKIIYINVSEDWARERLHERGRSDDVSDKSVEGRLAWFNSDVLPCIEFFKEKKDFYDYLEINGEQSIEDVHKEIISKLNF